MDLRYMKNGDYQIPNLIPNDEPEGEITKYGRMREKYLKDYKNGDYQVMILKGTLREHLLTIQEQAEQRKELLINQMSAAEGVNEDLKASDQMLWVQKMNNIQHTAEEIVLTELIYH